MIDNSEVQMKDIPENYSDIIEVIGLPNFLKLSAIRGGEAIYIPRPERLKRGACVRRIRTEFNGANHRELAKKFGVTVVWIRQILKQNDQ